VNLVEEKDIINEEIKNEAVEEKLEPQQKENKKKKNKKEQEIEKLNEEIKELNDKYLRTLAEMENFKKRIQQERIQERKYASSQFATQLLIPFDQLDKIVDYPTDNELLKNYLIGFKMIRDQFVQVFEQEGIKEIKALGEMFDANLHHAVEKGNDSEKPNGVILEVFQKGYHYKDRILRPAMVKVNEWSDNNGENK